MADIKYNGGGIKLSNGAVIKFTAIFYTVTFKDWDGTILKTESVLSGEDATPPSDPTRESYNFTGWSGTYTNVTSNRIITATYTFAPTGQVAYTTPGTYSWVAPSGVTSVCVVCVGGGGGGGQSSSGAAGGSGGGLGWKNNIPVTPGQSYTVVVGAGGVSLGQLANDGGDSYFINASTVKGGGGGGVDVNELAKTGGTFVGDGGGNGGNGGGDGSEIDGGGAGGAGGYTGNGGNGGLTEQSGQAGAGGGGGGSASAEGAATGGGGGVGLLGQGANGDGGIVNTTTNENGKGGSGGADGGSNGNGGAYGGGGQGTDASYISGQCDGASGAVRIIWGSGRAFPSTLTTDQ
jgi:hypothetical protein